MLEYFLLLLFCMPAWKTNNVQWLTVMGLGGGGGGLERNSVYIEVTNPVAWSSKDTHRICQFCQNKELEVNFVRKQRLSETKNFSTVKTPLFLNP